MEDITIDLLVLLAFGTEKAQMVGDSLAGLAEKNMPPIDSDEPKTLALSALLARLALRVPAAHQQASYGVGPWKR